MNDFRHSYSSPRLSISFLVLVFLSYYSIELSETWYLYAVLHGESESEINFDPLCSLREQ